MIKIKIIIAGSRSFRNYEFLRKTMEGLILPGIEKPEEIEVVCGGAKGADTLGKYWAKSKDIPVKMFPALWDYYGKKAGVLRNEEMAEYAKPDGMLCLFWDGESRGSAHMLKMAEAKGLLVYEFKILPGEEEKT